MVRNSVFCSVLLFTLSGCAANSLNAESDTETSMSEDAQTVCNLYESRGWQASLTGTEYPDRFRLTVSGEVDLPSPNYEVKWSKGKADRKNPPGLRISLSAGLIPDSMGIQVITPAKVKFTTLTTYSKFSGVSVYCGERVLTSFRDLSLD